MWFGRWKRRSQPRGRKGMGSSTWRTSLYWNQCYRWYQCDWIVSRYSFPVLQNRYFSILISFFYFRDYSSGYAGECYPCHSTPPRTFFRKAMHSVVRDENEHRRKNFSLEFKTHYWEVNSFEEGYVRKFSKHATNRYSPAVSSARTSLLSSAFPLRKDILE